jgi:hypothetical protein
LATWAFLLPKIPLVPLPPHRNPPCSKEVFVDLSWTETFVWLTAPRRLFREKLVPAPLRRVDTSTFSFLPSRKTLVAISRLPWRVLRQWPASAAMTLGSVKTRVRWKSAEAEFPQEPTNRAGHSQCRKATLWRGRSAHLDTERDFQHNCSIS